jgi:hypothetical protein
MSTCRGAARRLCCRQRWAYTRPHVFHGMTRLSPTDVISGNTACARVAEVEKLALFTRSSMTECRSATVPPVIDNSRMCCVYGSDVRAHLSEKFDTSCSLAKMVSPNHTVSVAYGVAVGAGLDHRSRLVPSLTSVSLRASARCLAEGEPAPIVCRDEVRIVGARSCSRYACSGREVADVDGKSELVSASR